MNTIGMDDPWERANFVFCPLCQVFSLSVGSFFHLRSAVTIITVVSVIIIFVMLKTRQNMVGQWLGTQSNSVC